MPATNRVQIDKPDPRSYKALVGVSMKIAESAKDAGLDAHLVELVKIRTSQINGCAFCLRMHTTDALERGESPVRLAVLPAWAETGYFSADERAALELTEAVTLVADGHVSDEAYEAAAKSLTEEQIAAVAWLTIITNAFNRVAITSRYVVDPS
jgi:AhpD family alkylhydroperoxidase